MRFRRIAHNAGYVNLRRHRPLSLSCRFTFHAHPRCQRERRQRVSGLAQTSVSADAQDVVSRVTREPSGILNKRGSPSGPTRATTIEGVGCGGMGSKAASRHVVVEAPADRRPCTQLSTDQLIDRLEWFYGESGGFEPEVVWELAIRATGAP